MNQWSPKKIPEEKGTDRCDLYNLGMEDDPKMVRIGEACSLQERKDILKLLLKYKDFIT